MVATTMAYTDFLSTYVDGLITQLQTLKAEGIKPQRFFAIDCEKLADSSAAELRESIEFKPIFEDLKKAPVLYWFEIISLTDRKSIRTALETYKDSTSPRATPALRVVSDQPTDVLYVGKVKSSFPNRLLQHLGYFGVPATQGLQLRHWARDLDLQLTLNVIEFEAGMAELMAVLEYALAKELRPLIGKHK